MLRGVLLLDLISKAILSENSRDLVRFEWELCITSVALFPFRSLPRCLINLDAAFCELVLSALQNRL